MILSPSSDDGTDLAEVHYRKYSAWSEPVKGTVLYFHGNKGNMQKCESEIEIFLERQYDVWTMDYREFGDSTGELSEKALVGDAKRVYDETISSGVKESDIVIECRIALIHGTFDEKIPFSSSERLYLRCRELNLPVGRHPIMCDPHDLRLDPEFKAIVRRILK